VSASVTLIHDATIVTGDDAGVIHYDAAVAIEGTRVTAIGPTADLLARYPDAERLSARGRAVFPGLANTHTHLSRVLARGIYEDLSPPHSPPFTGGLAPLPTPELDPDEERAMVLLGALEAIRRDTTLTLEEGTGI
jgi:5-methylthioadenosine/S-adenosylhomocysteine deaminase